MPIEYKKMSLFDAPKGSLLLHGCSCKGVWGSGIALEFKKRYPQAFKEYEKSCKEIKISDLLGKCFIYFDDSHYIGCLMTSKGYGKFKDPIDQILKNTELAINDLLKNNWYVKLYPWYAYTIYSNKFNSGLFGVPWEETEKILAEILLNYPNFTWIICDPNLNIENEK